jgi:hypothetical protein
MRIPILFVAQDPPAGYSNSNAVGNVHFQFLGRRMSPFFKMRIGRGRKKTAGLTDGVLIGSSAWQKEIA